MNTESIIALMNSKPAITAEIGSGVNMQLYPNQLPQKQSVWPAIVYRMLPNVPTNSFSGPSKFDNRIVDFFIYATSYDDAQDLMNILRDNLEDESGTYAGTVINHVLYVDDNDDYIDSLEKYGWRIEFNFNYRR